MFEENDSLGVDSIILSFERLSAPNVVLDRSTDGPFVPLIYVLRIPLCLQQKFKHSSKENIKNIHNWSEGTMMSSDTAAPSHLDVSDATSRGADTMKTAADPMATTGHMMSADDPDNPQNWPLYKKVYASAVAFAFAWVV